MAVNKNYTTVFFPRLASFLSFVLERSPSSWGFVILSLVRSFDILFTAAVGVTGSSVAVDVISPSLNNGNK